MTQKKLKVVVLGIGNLIMKDDGVGVRAVHALEQRDSPPDINLEIIDGGTEPDLSILFESGIDRLIIIDAVQAKCQPGAIYRFTPDVLESESRDFITSHDLNLRQSLAMMRIAGNLPADIVIIGIEPADTSWGTMMSPVIERKIPEIVDTILREIVLQSAT